MKTSTKQLMRFSNTDLLMELGRRLGNPRNAFSPEVALPALEARVRRSVRAAGKAGVRIGMLVKATGASKAMVARVLARMRAANAVKLRGEKRQAKYYPR